MTAMSTPSNKPLPNLSALVKVIGNPCFERTIWRPSNAGSVCQPREVTLPSGRVTTFITQLSRRQRPSTAPVRQIPIQSP
jgi:hypothetical protein